MFPEGKNQNFGWANAITKFWTPLNLALTLKSVIANDLLHLEDLADCFVKVFLEPLTE